MNFAILIFVVSKTTIEGEDGVEVYRSSELLSLVGLFKCCACHVETRLDCGGRQRERERSSTHRRPALEITLTFADFRLFNNNGCFFFQ